MGPVTDVGWIVLAIAVVCLFGWYFWHTVATAINYARTVTDYLDTRSERLRNRLEFEARHGRPPFWYRLMQKLTIVIVIAGVAALVWTKFRGA
jgi:hypothetical protein